MAVKNKVVAMQKAAVRENSDRAQLPVYLHFQKNKPMASQYFTKCVSIVDFRANDYEASGSSYLLRKATTSQRSGPFPSLINHG